MLNNGNRWLNYSLLFWFRPENYLCYLIFGQLSLLRFFPCFSINAIQCESSENQKHTKPLAGDKRISKQEHWGEDCKEFTSCGDYGAGQWAKVSHSHEDEIL